MSPLAALLNQLQKLIRMHGPRADVVREFIRQNHNEPEFMELAAVCILAVEKAER